MSNQNGVQWQAGDIILDLYKVVGILGQGSFGEVYKTRHLGWNTDLSVHNPSSATIATLGGNKNFEQQVETWIRLGLHSHIAGCYYIRYVNDHPLVFTEHVAGGSLRNWIDDRRLYSNGTALSLRRILDIAIQLAWGLHYAHEHGVIHENVTPNTVLITADGGAKITDFGLAQADATAIAYLSPEQPSPEQPSPEQQPQAPSTQQTDLWGWGLTVLEMFVGRCTWAAGTPAIQALDHYLDAPTDAQLPRMPVQVAQLLQRCFREDSRDERPASLREVANLLQTIYQDAIGRPYPRQEPPITQNTADDLNNRALFAWDLGRSAEAFRLWEQALITQPHHLETLYNRVLMLWRSGKVSDDQVLLLLQLERQSEISRSSAQGWQVDHLLSLVHMERGNYKTALQILEGIHAKGIQQEDIRAALALAKERLPHAKQLLPQLGEATRKKRTDHKIKAITLSPTSLYALSSGEEKVIRLWNIADGRCLCLFKGHEAQVLSVAFSPDGCSILSGGDDQTVRLWNVGDASQVHTFDGGERKVLGRYTSDLFKPLAVLVDKLRDLTRQWTSEGHQGSVRSVTFSPDGRQALSGGDDHMIKLWRVATGECLRTFRRHRGRILTVLFHPDRQHILSASDDQAIRILEIATGQIKQTFEDHDDLTSIACSPDGLYVLAGDNPIKLWDITTGQVVRRFEGHQGSVRSVVFNPDGRFFLSAGDDHQLKLWEVKTGRCLRTLEGHESVIRAIALSANGQHVLSADASTLNWWAVYSTDEPDLAPLRLSKIQLNEPGTGGDRLYEQELTQAQAALEQGDAVTAAQHTRQARAQLGYNRGLEAVQTWLNLYTALPRQTLKDSWEPMSFERYTAALQAVAFNLDGTVLAGSADSTLKLWDISTGRCLLSFEGHKGGVAAVAFNPVGRSALSGSADATLKLWDVLTAECLRTLVGHTAGVSSVAFSPTGRYALSGSQDTTLKLWEIATGRCLQTLKGHRDGVTAVAFSSDGRSVMSACADKTLKHWDIATGECLNTLEGHVAAVYAVDLSVDGRYVISGSADQTLKLWTVSGDCLRTFAGHTAAVRSVSLSTDGRYTLSSSDDKTCKLWNVVTGDCLWTFAGHTAAVRAASLSPDGRYVFSGSDDQSCKLWLLDWELADQPPRHWDEGASPYLETFLRLHTPSIGILPASRQPSAEEITLALTYKGTPTWTDINFSYLIQTLKAAGYGWLQPNGVRQQLHQMVRAIAQPVAQVDQVAPVFAPSEASAPFATAFATEFATAFGSSEPRAKVILSVIAGSLQGQEVEFDDRTICIIGRAKDCHVQLPNDELHKTISRYHCLLDINPPAARIRDLGSLHGTYINGQMIGKRQRDQTPEEVAQINFPEYDLANGDEIKLGQTVFSVRLESLVREESVEATAKSLNPFTGFLGSVPLVESSGAASGHENSLDLPRIEGYTPVKQLIDSEAGVVYLARQNATDQLVALKLLLPQKTVQTSVVETFLQEVELLKTLQHPNIIRLLDSGYENGAFFFAMDYFEGSSVVELMQQRGGRLPVDEAVAIALQVLEGFEYAHQVAVPVSITDRPTRHPQGLVHCDLKPSNILLPAGSVQTVKIADYGLAKAFDQAGLGGLSMSGTAAHLPVFMPRQQAVNFNYAEAEVDVWAIAACLYYMITGTYPRNFSSGKDPYLVLLQTDPISISKREITLPQPLADLIDQALVDNPQIIFKTATAFKQALEEIS